MIQSQEIIFRCALNFMIHRKNGLNYFPHKRLTSRRLSFRLWSGRRFKIGAQVQEVDEPHQLIASSLESSLIRSQAILQIEFDVIAEAKALLPAQISELYQKNRTYGATARLIGVSEGFVRQNVKLTRRKK